MLIVAFTAEGHRRHGASLPPSLVSRRRLQVIKAKAVSYSHEDSGHTNSAECSVFGSVDCSGNTGHRQSLAVSNAVATLTGTGSVECSGNTDRQRQRPTGGARASTAAATRDESTRPLASPHCRWRGAGRDEMHGSSRRWQGTESFCFDDCHTQAMSGPSQRERRSAVSHTGGREVVQ